MIEIFNELKATNSRLDKEQILMDNESKLLKKILVYALDPFKTFGIKKTPEYTPRNEVSGFLLWDRVFEFLDKLANRELTGNAAVEEYQRILNNLNVGDSEVLKKIIAKDLKCGVSTTPNRVWPGLIPSFKVQLASKFEEKKVDFENKKYVVEPKIDGMRCLAFVYKDHVEYYSRGGKPIDTLDHLTDEILNEFSSLREKHPIYNEVIILDGEVISSSFQTSMSDIKRKTKKEGIDIFFHIFDMIFKYEFDNNKCNTSYEARRQLIPKFENSNFIFVNEYKKVNSYEDVLKAYAEHIETGFEGTILKTLNGKYEFKRSREWMKIKPVETHDVKITSIDEGTGKYVGMMGAVHYDWKGRDGRVGTGFSDEDREWFWQNRDNIIGDIIEIECMEETELKEDGTGGIPRHSRYQRMRTFKGEKA